jgi:hypothetical protein
VTAPSDDLVRALVDDLRPVQPLAAPHVRLMGWSASLAAAAVVIAVVGVRRDWTTALEMPAVQAHSVLLLLSALLGALAALRLAVPGEAARWPAAVAASAAAVWVCGLAGELALAASTDATSLRIDGGVTCVAKVVSAGLVPGIVLLAMVVRGAPTATRPVTVLLAISGASVGALAAEWMCPDSRPVHLLAWHAGPLVGAIALVLAWRPGLPSSRAAAATHRA